MNDSIPEFITSSRKHYKRLLNSETVLVGSSGIEKVTQCKNLGVTVDKNLGFTTEKKTLLKKMAVCIKTIKTRQHRFSKTVLMLFHALVSSQIEHTALFLLQVTPMVLLSLEKLMNWALNAVFRSSVKGSFDLRIYKVYSSFGNVMN